VIKLEMYFKIYQQILNFNLKFIKFNQ